MKHLVFLIMITSALSAYVCADHAQGPYAGASAAYIGTDTLTAETSEPDKVYLPAFELVAGYKLNGWLGVDVRYGLGLGERDETYTGTTIERVEFSIDSYQSVYYRPEIVNKEAKLYFLLGYSNVEATAKNFTIDETTGDATSNGESSFSESGASYGMGAGWFVGEDIVVNVEYRQLLDKDSDEFGVVTLGADYRF